MIFCDGDEKPVDLAQEYRVPRESSHGLQLETELFEFLEFAMNRKGRVMNIQKL